MPIYREATAECVQLGEKMMAEHHPDLVAAGVQVAYLFAFGKRNEDGELTGPALKLRGWPCRAIVKINSHQDRVEGKGDVTIKVDGDEWPIWDDGERASTLDHELQHVIAVQNRKGVFKEDEGGRPVLKMRLHDFEYAGFAEIAKRHGDASQERRQAAHLVDKYGQLLFAWGDDMAPPQRNGAKGASEALAEASGKAEAFKARTRRAKIDDQEAFANKVGKDLVEAGVPLQDGNGNPWTPNG